jgi:glucose-6-phosphate isomerase
MKNQFSLRISALEMQRYYSGQARHVVVIAENGQRLQFSAELLRRFVTQDGVQGWFEIEYDDAGKLQSLVCLKQF